MSQTVNLRRIEMPGIGVPTEPPAIPDAEYLRRADDLYQRAGADWVVIYGDREHNANLLHLTGIDPRFEEYALLLGPHSARKFVVGIEGIGHAVDSRLPVDVVLAQSFGLMGQPRDRAARLTDVLRDCGIGAGHSTAVVGWKYRQSGETNDPARPAYVAAMLVDDLRAVTGGEPEDVTHLLMHPVDGQRARGSADQIAFSEWSAARTSTAVFRVVRAARPGMTERDAISHMGYAGEPMSMHPIVASCGPGEPINGLRSASGRVLHEGDAVTCGVGYWGSLTCRAGMLTDRQDDAFLDRIVRPYFLAHAAWYANAAIGATGGTVFDAVYAALEQAGAAFRPALNPGHLTSFDEWTNSPIRESSDERLASGMIFQVDIIPSPLPAGWILNCEDTVAIADEGLRAELAERHPEVWSRIQARRAFMTGELGLALAPELLPLSNINAYLPPFWLDPTLVCTLV
jgi:Xaa-Pro aminopeptidase